MSKGYGQAKAEADMYAEHLSLTYQLEILYGQAMQLALGRWRGSLAVEMDKKERQLILRYWTYVPTLHDTMSRKFHLRTPPTALRS